MISSAHILANAVIRPRSRCWHWTGARDKDGYGVVSLPRPRALHTQRAHRSSYQAFNGPIGVGLHVLHRCDNPGCVNPDHLFTGTNLENVQDCKRKGRLADTRGERHGQSKLTEGKVRAIRQLTGTYRGAQEEAAKRFGVSNTAISKIVRGLRWKHV